MPERTCVGCRRKSEKNDLIRFTYDKGLLVQDDRELIPGRGAYLCRENPECLEKAIKNKGFSRTLKEDVSEKIIRECFRNYQESRGEV